MGFRLAATLLAAVLALSLGACSADTPPTVSKAGVIFEGAVPTLDQLRGAAGKAALNDRVAAPPESVTPEAALRAAEAFDPSASGLRIVERTVRRSGDPRIPESFYQVQAADGRVFIVEQTSGNVVEVWGAVPLSSVGGDAASISMPLSRAEALEVATAFLRRVRPGFEYMAPSTDVFAWDAEDAKRFNFAWELIDENGFALRDKVRLSVDPDTGAIHRFHSAEGQPVGFPTRPTLSAEEAFEAVGVRMSPSIEAHLELFPSWDGSMHLVWYLYSKDDCRVAYAVDAHSGEQWGD